MAYYDLLEGFAVNGSKLQHKFSAFFSDTKFVHMHPQATPSPLAQILFDLA